VAQGRRAEGHGRSPGPTCKGIRSSLIHSSSCSFSSSLSVFFLSRMICDMVDRSVLHDHLRAPVSYSHLLLSFGGSRIQTTVY
jgi:hypothetical protein